ncbi:MAG: ROK family protein [Vulcanimicrobiota bacterium]
MQKAIGIDLGCSPVVGMLADIEGNILEKREMNLPSGVDYEYAVEVVKKIVRRLKHHGVAGIGLGVPGWLDSRRGICKFSPNFPDWEMKNMVQPFKDEFGLPTFISNDVNCAALGEKYYGAASSNYLKSSGPILLDDSGVSSALLHDSGIIKTQEVTSMFFMTIGVGIGGAAVIGKDLVTGANEGAGEIGHVTLAPDGPRCTCGNQGCFEALCSINAIKKGYAQSLEKGWQSDITNHINIIEDINFKIIKRCILNGDELTKKIISIAGKFIGMGIAVIVNMYDPQMIVIGGEVLEILDSLHSHILNEIRNRVRMISPQNVRFVPAKLGENSGAFGASALVLKKLYQI